MNYNFIYYDDSLLKKINKYSKVIYTFEQFKQIEIYRLNKPLYYSEFDGLSDEYMGKPNLFNVELTKERVFHQPRINLEMAFDNTNSGVIISNIPTKDEEKIYETYPDYLYFEIPKLKIYLEYSTCKFIITNVTLQRFIFNNKFYNNFLINSKYDYLTNIEISIYGDVLKIINNAKKIEKNIFNKEKIIAKSNLVLELDYINYESFDNIYKYFIKYKNNIEYSYKKHVEGGLCMGEIYFKFNSIKNKIYFRKKIACHFCLEATLDRNNYIRYISIYKIMIF